MSMHVTESTAVWSTENAAASPYNSGALDVTQFSECIVFIDGDVTSGEWIPKIQSQDPQTSVWMDRVGDQTFSAMNTSGGPLNDGLNIREAVRITDLGSIVRVVLTATGVSPEIDINVTLEGKT